MKHHLYSALLLSVPLLVLASCGGRTSHHTDDNGIAEGTASVSEDRDVSEPGVSAEPELRVETHYTGFVPYRNTQDLVGSRRNEIEVNTSGNSSNYVVLVKKNGHLVANVYISSNSSYTIQLPDGTYRVYFYSGEDWSPDVVQENGRKGGFINGRFTKDDKPLVLNGARMTYTLYAVENGNFSPGSSNADEAL